MLCFTDDFLLLDGFLRDPAHLRVVLSIKVTVVLWNVDVNFAAGFEVCNFEFGRFVVALGTPSNVVSIAESVDIKDVYVGWGKEEILDELDTVSEE